MTTHILIDCLRRPTKAMSQNGDYKERYRLTAVYKDLQEACKNNDMAKFTHLVDIKEKEGVDCFGEIGFFGNALHYALFYGCIEGKTKPFMEHVIALMKKKTVKTVKTEKTEEMVKTEKTDNTLYEATLKKMLTLKNRSAYPHDKGEKHSTHGGGNTPLHLAAYAESDELVKMLYDACPDSAKKKNRRKYTAQELMFSKTPVAITQIFDNCFSLVTEKVETFKEPRGQKRKLLIDFGLLVCGQIGFGNVETSLLTSLVRRQSKNSEIILKHPLVQIFLARKWKQLKFFIKGPSWLYFVFYLWYIFYIIQVYHISFPYNTVTTTTTTTTMDTVGTANYTLEEDPANHENLTVSDPAVAENSFITPCQYLFGKWASDGSSGGVDRNLVLEQEEEWSRGKRWTCKSVNFVFKSFLPWQQPGLFRSVAIIMVVCEMFQLLLLSLVPVMGRNEWESRKNHFLRYTLGILVGLAAWATKVICLTVFALLYSLLQILRYCLSYKLSEFLRRPGDGVNPVKKIFKLLLNGVALYLTQVENIFFLIFFSYLVHLPDYHHSQSQSEREGQAFSQPQVSKAHYVNAAVSVIVAGILGLFQLSSMTTEKDHSKYSLDLFIQMLKTVLLNFVGIMLKFLLLLIAFAVAFSILFPEDGLFQSLPEALLQVLPMMSGGLSWNDFFGKEGDVEANMSATQSSIQSPPFPISRKVFLAFFIVVVTIVMMNLLLGLTFTELEVLSFFKAKTNRQMNENVRKKSEKEYTTVRVNRLYAFDGVLSLFSIGNVIDTSRSDKRTQINFWKLCPTLQSEVVRIIGKGAESQEELVDPSTKPNGHVGGVLASILKVMTKIRDVVNWYISPFLALCFLGLIVVLLALPN